MPSSSAMWFVVTFGSPWTLNIARLVSRILSLVCVEAIARIASPGDTRAARPGHGVEQALAHRRRDYAGDQPRSFLTRSMYFCIASSPFMPLSLVHASYF